MMEVFPSNMNLSDDFEGKLPIHFAALSGQVTLFRNLKQHGSLIHTTDKFNRNILHFASKSGSTKMVREILELIRKKCEYAKWMIGDTCTYVEHEHIYRVQIECGCKHPTLVQIHVRREILHKFLVNLRLPYSQRCKDMHKFGVILGRQCTYKECAFNRIESQQKDLPSGTPIKPSDLTPLMTAILSNNHHLVPLLVNNCTTNELKKTDRFGFTAFDHACIMGSFETIKSLLATEAFTNESIESNISLKGELSCKGLALKNDHLDIVYFLMGRAQIKKLARWILIDASITIRRLKEETLNTLVADDVDIVDHVLEVLDKLTSTLKAVNQ